MIWRFLVAIILIGVVSGGLVAFNLYREKAMEGYFANAKPPPVAVSATKVEAIAWTPVIEAFGTLNASRGVELSTQTAGIVREIAFAANQSVSEGQLLVQLDDRIEQADLIAAQAAVDRDTQTLERGQTLSERGVASAATLQDAQTALAVSRSQLEKLRAVLDQKAIEAPFPGVIGIPRIEVGQFVTPGTAIATLQNLEKMRVDFTVPEQDFGLLSIGQAVHAGLEDDSATYEGRIVGIDPRVDPASRLVSVRAEIDAAEGRLQPGSFARVEVVLPQEQGVIALPQTAIVTSLYGDFVYRVEPQSGKAAGDAQEHVAQQVFVTTGRRSGGIVEIVKGIAAGDLVVDAGQNRLSSGARVTVNDKVEPAAAAAPVAAKAGAAQ